MHNINYFYSEYRNRLDSITATGINSSSYDYDAIGNLTEDNTEDIQITWNAAGKVKQAVTPECTINYTYNPLGQRQSKEIIGDSTVKEWYIHDATGNIMCIYDSLSSKSIICKERPLYGSSRLGIDNKEIIIKSGNWGTLPDTNRFRGYCGYRNFELSNHLGNVLTTFSDRKWGMDDNSDGIVDYYKPVVTSWTDYYPFGYPMPNRNWNSSDYRFGFNGQEKDNEIYGEGESYSFEFRNYDARLGRFWSVDPLTKDYPYWTPYIYCSNNPILLIDLSGKEPIKPYIGTAAMFVALLNNSPRSVGNYTGKQASDYLKSLGSTKWSWKQMRPLPTETGYFNKKKGRYIYTEKGGWIDMAHFMFYAGKAYNYKLQKEAAQKAIIEMKESGGNASQGITAPLIKEANMDPVGEAVQAGYQQEKSDRFAAKYSAYSYEDLPSDKLGAEFGANYFDPNSKLSFSQQLQNYLNELGATDPKNAPNYNILPNTEPTDKPTRTNNTTKPVYIE